MLDICLSYFDFFHSNIPGMLCIPLTRFQMNKLDFFLSKACGSIDIVLSFKILILFLEICLWGVLSFFVGG